MAMRTRNELTIQHPNAAGIDIGSSSHFVAVPADRSASAVREFGCYTQDLYEMAAWLLACGITIVALESTGVYWIPCTKFWKPTELKSCWSMRVTSARVGA